MIYKYNKALVKDQLTFDNVFDILNTLGGEPIRKGNTIISKTICHCGTHHKLYYYDNSKLFKCYTECEKSVFDIFELVQKIKIRENGEFSTWQAVQYIAEQAHLIAIDSNEIGFPLIEEESKDWKILNKKKQSVTIEKPIVELKHYDDKILQYYPQPHIDNWEKEGIAYNVILEKNIRYNPVTHGIIIPHYDKDNNLVGIRERTMIAAMEEYGKYRPAVLNQQMYNHPLGYNLYNLNNSKNNIRIFKKAIIMEGEKSCLKYASFFGSYADISCATCGSSLSAYQIELLKECGAEEIVIGFDRQFKTFGDDEWKLWTGKLRKIYDRFKSQVLISFIFDSNDSLKYKDSPIDEGADTFIKLFNQRVYL